jgi:hypothetical protein
MSHTGDRPQVTVTRPDDDGRPVELLELGPEKVREVPSWVKRAVAGGLVVLVLLGVGGDLEDRWQRHRLAQQQADAVALVAGLSGGGPTGGGVDLAVGFRNDGPRALRLRDPRLEVLDGAAAGISTTDVTVPDTVAAGAEVSLTASVRAPCPPPDLAGRRVVASVTGVSESGREERIEVPVTSMQDLLEAACREPSSDGDVVVEVQEPRLDGDVLRVRLDVRLLAGGELVVVEVSSPSFEVAVRHGVGLPPVSGILGVELDLTRPRCDRLEQNPGGSLVVPVQLVLRAIGGADTSGAGSGRGPRPDGRDPDQDGTTHVVQRELAGDGGVAGSDLAVAAEQLVALTCTGPENR